MNAAPAPRRSVFGRVAATILLLIVVVGAAGAFKYRHEIRERVHEAKQDGIRSTVKTALKTAYHSVKQTPEEAAEAVAPPAPLPERADEPLVIFGEALGEGWQDWSWSARTLGPVPFPYKGASAIQMTPTGNKGVYLHHDTLSTGGYGFLTFALRSQSPLNITLVDPSLKFLPPVRVESTKGAWVVKKIPLSSWKIEREGTGFSGVVFQDLTNKDQPTAFIDEVALLPDPTLAPAPTSATVAVTVDMKKNSHAISPYIYGMAFAPPDYITDLKLTLNRWGGNDKTRYNWQLGNACNAARDWNFANRTATGNPPFPDGPSSATDYFTRQNQTSGAQTMLTVPMIGWVAKDTDNSHTSKDVPGKGGDPLSNSDGAIKGYDPSANRARTSVRSVARQSKARPGEVAQDAWIKYLTRTFGPSGTTGVRFYAMDNEPDLWDGNHTDVHPARMGYDDLIRTFYDYATAVKDVDPTAQVTGPVSWGWTGYQYSPLDAGSDNYHTYADRKKHGDVPFVLWFLQQARARDAKAGRRNLDVLDVHYYPQGQGLYGGARDKDAQTRRLRSTRSLWDPTYKDESWIGEPVHLVPLMKEWIAKGYPGTKLGITEWNFGADTDISGGLADLDALGIFGRENVYLANFWAYPGKDGPGYLAFKLMRNPDGKGNGFGDTSGQCLSVNEERVSAFAATRKADGALTVMFVNKMPKANVTVPLKFAPGSLLTGAKTATLYRLLDNYKQIVRAAKPIPITNGATTITLPPYSGALLVIGPPAPQ